MSKSQIKVGVYKLTNTVTEDFYIGSSCQIPSRLSTHFRGSTGCTRISRAIKKYGRGAFKAEVLLQCRRADLPLYEKLCIARLKPAYNVIQADECGGWVLSSETKAKIAAKQTGRKASDETRAKLSAAHVGHKLSPEHSAKLKASRLGKGHTEESKAKMSAAKKGIVFGEEFRQMRREKMLGTKHSEETKARMSASQKARRLAEAEAASVKKAIPDA